jgi:two-component system LytT family response regulator
MTVRVLIADDEPVARAGLREMLAEVSWLTCVGEAANGPAALERIEALRPELVFLDIQMPGLLGTELLPRLRHQPLVVFTTAYAEHAVTAFELGALDYLLKPFGPERLARALERVQATLGEPLPWPATERLHEALTSGPISRLFVRAGGAIVPVPVATVTWFEALGDYVGAHVREAATRGGAASARHLVHLSLNRLEGRLDPKRFARIHRRYIVNLDHVKAFRRWPQGALVAELDDGTELAVSRSRARELRDLAV